MDNNFKKWYDKLESLGCIKGNLIVCPNSNTLLILRFRGSNITHLNIPSPDLNEKKANCKLAYEVTISPPFITAVEAYEKYSDTIYLEMSDLIEIIFRKIK